MSAQHNHPPQCCCPPAGTPGDDCPACPVHGVFASPRRATGALIPADRIAAAKLRVKLGEKLNDPAPEWVQRLAAHGDLPETMFRTRDFDDSTDENLRSVQMRRLDEGEDDEWYR